MNRFKVITGMHIEGDRAYKKGEIVVSPLPLDEMFKGKFTNEGPAPKPAPAPAPKPLVKKGE